MAYSRLESKITAFVWPDRQPVCRSNHLGFLSCGKVTNMSNNILMTSKKFIIMFVIDHPYQS